MRLFDDPTPPLRDLIDLRCCNVRDLIDELLEDGVVPDVVISDPPWTYDQTHASSRPEDHYEDTLSTGIIANHVAIAPGRLLVLWLTNPLIPEWVGQHRALPRTLLLGAQSPWEMVSAGAWAKSDGRLGDYGPGYWWAGCCEPVWIYKRGAAHNSRSELRNAWLEPRGAHSAKPIGWQAAMVRRWCPPGGLVLDMYAGDGTVACAVLSAGEGRRYVGAEINASRYARACAAVAQWRT